MRYESTRGKAEKKSGSQAILSGVAEDGGLYVPEKIPVLERTFQEMRQMSYAELGSYVLSLFFPEFSKEKLEKILEKAYSEKFVEGKIAPIVSKGEMNFLELHHGPTLAFKDMALTVLPELMQLSMEIEKQEGTQIILVATSGDTGKATLEGFKNKRDIEVIVFYPKEGVSPMQKQQMITDDGQNIYVVAVDGNFDDAQRGVKEIFLDQSFQDELKKQKKRLTSANSINIGRLIPQIIYYIYGYVQLVEQGKVQEGERLNVSVPTGNFGNILAAYYAKKMGLPIGRLICSSNENKVLYDFFQTGLYDRNRPLVCSSSPSMDILISSNLERLLFEVSGRDARKIEKLMFELAEKGQYKIDDAMRNRLQDFFGAYGLENEVKTMIKSCFMAENYLIDPHTAVALVGYQKYKKETGDLTPTLIISTASPYKFSETVSETLGIKYLKEDPYTGLKKISEVTETPIPQPISRLEGLPVRFTDVWEKEKINETAWKFFGL